MAQNIDKIRTFMGDPEMSRSVHEVLMQVFLRTPSNKDVQTLAAAWMAKDLLDVAWKELERLKVDINTESKEIGNIGL